MGFAKGLVPSRVVPDKWWETPVIEDPLAMKPSENEVLLIVGDATDVLADVEKFIEICPTGFDTMCINYSAKLIPWEIQHFIAGDSHTEDMQKQALLLPDSCLKHCWNPKSHGFNIRWLRNGRTGWNGTTANLGIKIGIALGYTRIVLAGIPMDNSGNWYSADLPDDDIKKKKDHRDHLWKWNEIASRPVSRLLRSMSGNTAELLGKPSREWIEEALLLKEKVYDSQRNEDQNKGRSRKEVESRSCIA